MKAYRFIGVSLVSVDRNGNTKTDADWTVDITPGSITRFAVKGCKHTGLDQVFRFILDQLVRII